MLEILLYYYYYQENQVFFIHDYNPLSIFFD